MIPRRFGAKGINSVPEALRRVWRARPPVYLTAAGQSIVRYISGRVLDCGSGSTGMVRTGEIEHAELIAGREEKVWCWSTPAGENRVARRAGLLIDLARITPDSTVLELGCGAGTFTRVLAETGARIVAVDVSPTLVERTRARHSAANVTFRIEDAELMSFDDGTFDAVVGSSVLHHLALEPALREVYRVLKPGGWAAFAEPNMMNPQIALERSSTTLRHWMGQSPEETAFLRWKLTPLLRELGFVHVRAEPYDFLHPAVPRPLIPLVKGLGAILEQVPLLREFAGSLIVNARRA